MTTTTSALAPPAPPEMTKNQAAGALRELQRRNATGRLHASTGSWRRELFLSDGRIVGVRTSVEAERLGSLLVRLGRITRQQAEDAAVFVRRGWRTAEILAELKIIDRNEIYSMLRRQAMEIAGRILQEDADVSFDETTELFSTLSAPLSVADVLIEHARWTIRNAGVPDGFAADHAVYHSVEAPLIAGCSCLTLEEAYLLSRFQGGSTPASVLSATGLEASVTERALYCLIESGLLVGEDAPAIGPASPVSRKRVGAIRDDVDRMYRRLTRLDPWRALNLPKNASTEDARTAFREAVMKYHPDRYQWVEDSELQKRVTTICESFTTAFTSLTTALQMRRTRPSDSVVALASTNVASPLRSEPERSNVETIPAVCTEVPKAVEPPIAITNVAPPRSDTGCDADVYFRAAVRAMAEMDYWRATELLQAALERKEDEPSYHFLMGQALAKNRRWRHEAEKSYRRAIELDPYTSKHYEALARLYLDIGLEQRAERTLREARELGLQVECS